MSHRSVWPYLTMLMGATSACSGTLEIHPPADTDVIERFNGYAQTRNGQLHLTDGDIIHGEGWMLQPDSIRYRSGEGIWTATSLGVVEKISIPMTGGELRGRAGWKGLYVGGGVGAVLGTLAWLGGTSCSPQPCTPPRDAGPEAILIGAATGSLLGYFLGNLLGGLGSGSWDYLIIR